MSKQRKMKLGTLNEHMAVLLRVWDGTDNAHEVLEDAYRTIVIRSYGFDPQQATASWAFVKREANQ